MSDLSCGTFSWPAGDAFVRGAREAIRERRKRCVRCGVPFAPRRGTCPGRDFRNFLVVDERCEERCPTCGGDVYERGAT